MLTPRGSTAEREAERGAGTEPPPMLVGMEPPRVVEGRPGGTRTSVVWEQEAGEYAKVVCLDLSPYMAPSDFPS